MKQTNANTVSTPSRPTAMDAHVLGTLQYLRETVNTAGFYSSVPGTAGIAMGSIGIVAAGAAASPALAKHWLLVWLVAAGLAIPVGTTLMVRSARREGLQLHRGASRRFVLCLCPAFAAAAVLTWALFGVAAASVLSIPLLGAMGLAFMLLGAVALFTPPVWANLLLGAGFGGLHIIFGALLAHRNHG